MRKGIIYLPVVGCVSEQQDRLWSYRPLPAGLGGTVYHFVPRPYALQSDAFFREVSQITVYFKILLLHNMN